MKKRWFMLCLVGAILLCAGCGNVETSPETPPADETEEASPLPETEAPPSSETLEPVDETDRVEVYSDEEITITVPAAYEDLVQVDSVGTDNLFVVSANLYYAPEYSQGEQGEFSDSPSLCGGWMLTGRMDACHGRQGDGAVGQLFRHPLDRGRAIHLLREPPHSGVP